MNRLTNNQGFARNIKAREEMYDKLFELEDIEEKLGCPLEVLFKALENGIYTIDKTWYSLVNMHFECKDLYCQAKLKNSIMVHIKDYKKTWWLKEDRSE